MTKILIVDEDTDVLRLLRVKLSGAGYEVSRAQDGQEALALAEAEQPEQIVTELLLPDVDGIDLLSRLQSATAIRPLIVVLSGKTTDADIAAALSAGAVDYVTKPFSPQGLLERIRVNMIRTQLADVVGQEG
jgi:DNA-binding response OmpR family regulator